MEEKQDNYTNAERVVEVIYSLQEQIKGLIAKYEQAVSSQKRYYDSLIKANENLKTAKNKIVEQEKKIAHYELKAALQASSNIEGEDAKKARQRVLRLIKEIDGCISLLNS